MNGIISPRVRALFCVTERFKYSTGTVIKNHWFLMFINDIAATKPIFEIFIHNLLQLTLWKNCEHADK